MFVLKNICIKLRVNEDYEGKPDYRKEKVLYNKKNSAIRNSYMRVVDCEHSVFGRHSLLCRKLNNK